MTCDKVFLKPCMMKRHIRVHSGEKPFSCPVCNKSFSQACHLKGHQLQHSKVKPNLSRTKISNILKGLELKDHIETKSVSFENENIYSNEEREIKIDAEEGEVIHTTNTSSFQCNMCNSSFSTLDTLQYHKLDHAEKKIHCCKKCKKRFKFNSLLRNI